jgi:Terminase large subunit, T4likevirus-type, N-terminal
VTTDITLPPLFELSPRQSEFLAASENDILFGGSAGGGKSFSLVIKALGLNNVGISHPEYRALIIRKSFEDLDTILKYQKRIYEGTSYPPPKWREQAKEWVWPNGATVSMGYLATKSDLDRYTGNEYSFIGVEEVCDTIPSLDWWQLLSSRCRSDIAGLYPMICGTTNPRGRGFAWVQSHWAVAPDGKSTRQVVVTDEIELNGIIIPSQKTTRRYIQSIVTDNVLWAGEQKNAYIARLQGMADNERNALLYGRWDYAAADDLLIHPEIVARAAIVPLNNDRKKIGTRIIGIDPAHQGRDMSVVIHRKLNTAFNLTRYGKLDSMQLAYKIKQIIDKASDDDGNRPIVNIDYAMGTGPSDRLREMGYKINTVHFSAKPNDPAKYLNKRAEMYGEMAEAMSAAIEYRIPDDAALKQQLSAVMIDRDSSGRLKIAPKTEIKKSVGRSPDEADALALTYAASSNQFKQVSGTHIQQW